MAENKPLGGVTELLGVDHRRLDGVLADVKKALVVGDRDSARTRFAEFRDGLEHHIELEEQVLFPAFERWAGLVGGGPTHVMRVEHGELRRLMAEAAADLEEGSDTPPTPLLAQLTACIAAHNGKEERILYPAVDRAAREAGALQDLLHRLVVR